MTETKLDIFKVIEIKIVEISNKISTKKGVYDVSVTKNGIHFTWIFCGTKKECKIISDAFVKVGYEFEENIRCEEE